MPDEPHPRDRNPESGNPENSLLFQPGRTIIRIKGGDAAKPAADSVESRSSPLSTKTMSTKTMSTKMMSTKNISTKNIATLRQYLKKLPQIERLLRHPELKRLLQNYPRREVVRALRECLENIRQDIQGLVKGRKEGFGDDPPEQLADRVKPDSIAEEATERLAKRERRHYGRVINATEIILHTGLGRAVLAKEAVQAVSESIQGYALVEVDQVSGERNRREGHVAGLVRELTGAEAATVVNNNAGATLIILATLARGREVVISRGQLVEIGGSFRIPSIMEESGARLVEVGATNRTYIEDYRRAITPDTGLLLQVHTSNYEIEGFACHTPLEELVELGREHGIPVVSDLGSGCFIDLSTYGFRREPLVVESVQAGADLVCFSGDKLLGGPQAGIIVGRRESVERVRRHPLFRALRIDKMTLSALEATLKLYRDPETLLKKLPALSMITQTEKQVRQRADRLRRQLLKRVPRAEAELVKEGSQMGSGSLPAQELPTYAVAVRLEDLPPDELSSRLRANEPPIFTRIRNDRVLFDLRTLLTPEAKMVVDALEQIAATP